MPIDFRLDRQQLLVLLDDPQHGAAATAVMRHGNRVLNRARQLCPVDEGRLRASLTIEMRVTSKGPIARVGSNVRYAMWVHEGTGLFGPHQARIVPVQAKALKWPKKNNTGVGRRRFKAGETEEFVYAKSVKGMPGRPFLLNALKQTT